MDEWGAYSSGPYLSGLCCLHQETYTQVCSELKQSGKLIRSAKPVSSGMLDHRLFHMHIIAQNIINHSLVIQSCLHVQNSVSDYDL